MAPQNELLILLIFDGKKLSTYRIALPKTTVQCGLISVSSAPILISPSKVYKKVVQPSGTGWVKEDPGFSIKSK